MNLVQLSSFIMNLSTLVFVVTSMLAMGLSLTVAQILAPLRNTRLVILALAANFVLAPIAAYLITQAFPLTDSLKTGLILVSTAAGAPFLPRLAQMAKGNLAFSVGLMVLLMVTTVLYMPLMLPLLVGGVTVNPWDIARPLIFLMLFPLAAALFVKARYTQRADILAPLPGEGIQHCSGSVSGCWFACQPGFPSGDCWFYRHPGRIDLPGCMFCHGISLRREAGSHPPGARLGNRPAQHVGSSGRGCSQFCRRRRYYRDGSGVRSHWLDFVNSYSSPAW